MTINVQQFQPEKYTADATVVFVLQDEQSLKEQTAMLQSVWESSALLFASNDFSGKKDTSAVIYTGSKKTPRLILVGLGESGKLNLERIRRAGATAAQRAAAFKCQSIALLSPNADFAPQEDIVQALVEGVMLASYSFDKYFTENKKDPKDKLAKLTILAAAEDLATAKKGAAVGEGVANGVITARNLINAPGNEIYPETLAQRAKQELTPLGVKVTILDKKKIEALKMGGLLAVNQGSINPPVFIIMEYNGGKKGEAPLVFVGKGITFDSGGISLKPGAGMADMKMDMGGSGAVVGAMRAIAELKLQRHVVGLIPSTENMPSGNAYKPGDVITFMNGKTAEIDNTDAEGRLVLADALTYADRYKPQAVIDLATLTGAITIALGEQGIGLFSNNRELAGTILESGERTYDRAVEFPLWEEYEDLIKSDIADVKNSGGRQAGSITAALFLQHFIGNYPWAHLDIAGSGMTSRASGYISKGGNGSGVRLLVDLVRNWKGVTSSAPTATSGNGVAKQVKAAPAKKAAKV